MARVLQRTEIATDRVLLRTEFSRYRLSTGQPRSRSHFPVELVSDTDRVQYSLHRKNGLKVILQFLSGKTQGIWKFCQNAGNLFCSNCKFLVHDVISTRSVNKRPCQTSIFPDCRLTSYSKVKVKVKDILIFEF